MLVGILCLLAIPVLLFAATMLGFLVDDATDGGGWWCAPLFVSLIIPLAFGTVIVCAGLAISGVRFIGSAL